jgi:hypothetical protein
MNKVYLINDRNHPITISYDGRNLIVPSRGKRPIKNLKLLGAVPKGIKLFYEEVKK